MRSEMIVSTAWLAAHLNDPKVVVLHVARARAHYDEGHIPGARFAGWDEITATRDGVPNELAPVADLQKLFERLGIGDDARIVLYGDNSGLAAARAYFTLDYLGHGGRAALLDGGLEKWKAERRAISTDMVEPKTARFTPRVRASAVTNLDVVRDLSWTATNLTSPSAVLIDARPVDEYTGTKPGEGVPRGGHIPGAANVFWMQNVVSKENPALRSVAELRKSFIIWLKLSNYPLELFIHLSSYCVESRIVSYHRQHRPGVYRRNYRFSRFVSFINDDVAGKEQSDVDLLLQSLVCERRIAGAEDHIVAEINTELLFQFLLYVDFREHAEAFLFERGPRFFDSLLVRNINCLTESVF